jgi:hypothetical protein
MALAAKIARKPTGARSVDAHANARSGWTAAQRPRPPASRSQSGEAAASTAFAPVSRTMR